MIPIGDDLPQFRTPWMTIFLLALMWAVWLLVEQGGLSPPVLAARICDLGLVPGELTHRAPLGEGVPIGAGLMCVVDNSPVNVLTPLISIFLHGSWSHIIGNSIFFWVFGKNIEDTMGHGRYLVFFLVCGLVAAMTHVLLNAASPVPTVGASGAISAIMGGYLLLYPKSRIRMLFFFLIVFPIFMIPAWIVLLWWFAVQVIEALPQLTQVNPEVSGGVAVWAHVGGFLSGLILIKLFANARTVEAHKAFPRGGYGYSRWG